MGTGIYSRGGKTPGREADNLMSSALTKLQESYMNCRLLEKAILAYILNS